MYPIFITDDSEAEVEIKSLPGQKRCMSLAEPTDVRLVTSTHVDLPS